MLYIIFLTAHILCSVIVLLGIAFGHLRVHKYMFFVVLLIPLWGLVLTLILHFRVGAYKDGKYEIQVEKMKLESELYKSVTVDEGKGADSIVPIEEALLVNSARERREIIMDVLNDNPKEYVEFLKKAGNNEDTEVVHYAVTAMVEISKENDYTLQQLETRYSRDPDNYEVLEEYCSFLWSCLEQGLMQGQVEIMNRNLFSSLMKKKISMAGGIDDYVKLATNELKLGNYTVCKEIIDEAYELWPISEECVILRLRYFASLGDSDGIKALIEETERGGVYLSSRAKEELAFWKS